MLKIHIPAASRFNDITEEFIETKELDLELEHSLVAISEWEAKYKKPFLTEVEKTESEMFDYIQMMVVKPEGITTRDLVGLTKENVESIKAYIDDKRTATTISKDQQGKPTREIITSELIYCWMCQQQIPWEAENWHISRLLMLINVVSIKNQPPKKQSTHETMKQHSALNKARRAQHTKPHIPHH